MIPELDLSGKTVVLGIGSPKSDDFVGLYVVRKLNPSENLIPIDCGNTPENFLGKVASEAPDSILIVDAADFGGTPGESRIIDPTQIQLSISTHNPTDLLIKFLESVAPVTTLGIQSQSKTEFTEPVKKTAEEIIKILNHMG